MWPNLDPPLTSFKNRTWDIQSQIHVLMFDSKIEIFSSGGLPAGITQEEYLRGNVSVPRNPILGNLFYRLHIVEILGTGILRILDSYKDNPRQPEFEFSDNSIRVTLPLLGNPNLSEDETTVLNTLSQIFPQSISKIKSRVPFGKSKTAELLKQLMKKGYVIKDGNGRGTKYRKR